MNTILFHTTENDANLRLDQFIATHLPGCTRTKAQTLIEAGAVHLNNYPSTKSNKTIRNGDVITIFPYQTGARKPKIDNFSLFFNENAKRITERE